ncbi:non-oxidative hydroxyarylic acid decarboxylases subunit D [Streptomyces sp. NPDC057743]|uniref:non-oxidative hydroxyarylic acid decarboxylases subunit D n=1 Tax=Streptomyces sp. NPDC057743 TaxID=3346236 RepID=UPI0036B96C36
MTNNPPAQGPCPRCAFETIARLATSPVPDVWNVLQCGRCLYTWRTTEPARRTQRDAYPENFKLTPTDIANAIEVPEVPPLLK